MSDISSVPVRAPSFRRLWVVVLMTCLLIPMPLACLLLITGPIYRRKPEGWQPISDKARYIYGGALVLWLVVATLKAFLQPGGIQGEWERSADPTLLRTTQNAPAPTNADPAPATASSATNSDLPTCDNPEVIQTAREAIDESPAGVTMGLRVRDVGKGQETLYEPDRKLRRCVAEAMLNSGASIMTFQILYGPSGNLMVQSQVGDSAMMQYEVDKAKRDAAKAAALADVRAAASSASKTELTANDLRDRYSADYRACISDASIASGRNSDALLKCIEAEFDLQNEKYRAEYQRVFGALEQVAANNFRADEIEWSETLKRDCAASSSDPTSLPNCYLTATMRRTIELERR